jgi:hypothetical protein
MFKNSRAVQMLYMNILNNALKSVYRQHYIIFAIKNAPMI